MSGTQEALKQELARKGRADKAKRENVKEMRRKQDEDRHVTGARKAQERMEKIERIAEGRTLNVEKRAAMQVRGEGEQKRRRGSVSVVCGIVACVVACVVACAAVGVLYCVILMCCVCCCAYFVAHENQPCILTNSIFSPPPSLLFSPPRLLLRLSSSSPPRLLLFSSSPLLSSSGNGHLPKR